MATAVAYTSDIIDAPNGEVIHRDIQAERIKRFAAERAVKVVAWFEDDSSEPDLMRRPGVRALFSCDQRYDLVLCERVWALSRSMAALEPFFKELDRRGAAFETATAMWDAVSQQCRRRSKSLAVKPAIPEPSRYRVAKPARFNFVHLVHHTGPSISRRL
jgi:DNA invertase Pin-like site-specific DNA recombinase